MHCKHCGNQIENDSKFCSFCGGKVAPIEPQLSPIQIKQNLTSGQHDTFVSSIQQTGSSNFINAFLVIALIDFGFSLFWIILQIIARTKEDGYKIYEQLQPVTKPLGIINSTIILFLCFLYTKKKEHKTLFLILGICVLAWRIYDTYIKTY